MNLHHNPKYLHTQEGVKIEKKTISALYFKQFLERIIKDLKNLKTSPTSVSPLEAKLLVQAVGLFIYTSHKSMSLLLDRVQLGEMREVLINEMFSALEGDPEADSNPQYAISNYNDLNELLDHLSFVPPEGDLSTRLSYLDSYSDLGAHHLALEAFGNLQNLVRSLRTIDSYRADKFWFNSLAPLVMRRLEDFELDSYFSSQLPNYNHQIQILIGEKADQSDGQQSEKLLTWTSKKCIENLEKIVKGGLLDKLIYESPRKAYAKDQLVNYYMGWHLLWFRPIIDVAESHNYSCYDMESLDRESIRNLIGIKYLLKLFNIEEQGKLDSQQKELIGFLFFLGVTYYMDIADRNPPEDSEEDANTIAKLLSYYFNPKMVDFNFLYRLHAYLKTNYCHPVAMAMLQSTFVKQIQLLDIWFSDNLLECDSGPAMTTGNRRWPSQYRFGTGMWYAMPIIYPHFDVGPYWAEEGANYGWETYDEKQAPIIIKKFQQITEKLKGDLEKFDDLIIGVLQGKINLYAIGAAQRRLETQLEMYPDLFEAIKINLKKEENTQLGHEAFKMFSKDLGDLGGKGRFYFIFYERNGLRLPIFNADGFFEILDLISNLGEKYFSIYTNPKYANSLSKKELDDFARLNYYSMKFDRYVETNLKNPEKHKIELTKIYTSEKFNPENIVDVFYQLIPPNSVFTQHQIEFPVFSLIPKNPPTFKSIFDSLFGYLLFAFHREKDNSNHEVSGKVFEALNSRLNSAINELSNISTTSSEAQLDSAITNLSHWIDLISIFCRSLGENYDDIKGWSDFVINENLVNKLPKLISIVEEKFGRLNSNLSKDVEMKKIYVVYSIIQLGLTIKSKVFGWDPSEFVREMNDKASLSLKEKKNIILNLATALAEMFLNLDLSNPIILPEIKSQIPSEYNETILSLLLTEDLPDETWEDSKENNKISSEDIRTQYFASWRQVILAHYNKYISQLLLCFSKANPSINSTLEQAVKVVFFFRISKKEPFQEYITKLHKEAEKIFEAFGKEDIDKLADLKTEVLPTVSSSLKPGINSLFSAVLYTAFHEKVIAVVPKADREFVPPTLSEDIFFEFSSEITIKFFKLLDDKTRDLYQKDIDGIFPSGLTPFNEKPAENRIKKHASLYETPANDFNSVQLKDIELIYQESKKTLLNQSLFNTSTKKLDCANLLLMMIWNKEYAERAVNDGIIEHLFNLEGDVNTTILPFIVEMVIGNQIPFENRIEIALKAALLRAGSVKVLLGDDTVLALKPLLFENPILFRKIYQNLFTVKKLSDEEGKSTSDFTVTLKSEHGKNTY
mgnify:FL=1